MHTNKVFDHILQELCMLFGYERIASAQLLFFTTHHLMYWMLTGRRCEGDPYLAQSQLSARFMPLVYLRERR
jgi:hypothetical protein